MKKHGSIDTVIFVTITAKMESGPENCGVNYPLIVCPSFSTHCNFCPSISSHAFSCPAISVAPAYGLASAYSVRALQSGQFARYNFFVCGPKFTSSGSEDTPTSPEVTGTNTLNFRPNFKLSRSFLGGRETLSAVHFLGVRYQGLVNL